MTLPCGLRVLKQESSAVREEASMTISLSLFRADPSAAYRSLKRYMDGLLDLLRVLRATLRPHKTYQVLLWTNLEPHALPEALFQLRRYPELRVVKYDCPASLDQGLFGTFVRLFPLFYAKELGTTPVTAVMDADYYGAPSERALLRQLASMRWPGDFLTVGTSMTITARHYPPPLSLPSTQDLPRTLPPMLAGSFISRVQFPSSFLTNFLHNKSLQHAIAERIVANTENFKVKASNTSGFIYGTDEAFLSLLRQEFMQAVRFTHLVFPPYSILKFYVPEHVAADIKDQAYSQEGNLERPSSSLKKLLQPYADVPFVATVLSRMGPKQLAFMKLW